MAQINDEVLVRATFRNRAGDLDDPTTVKCGVLEPDDVTTPILLTPVSTGIYEGTYIFTKYGEHWFRVEGTGAVTTAEERKISVTKPKVTLA